jgi:hypothetical protein
MALETETRIFEQNRAKWIAEGRVGEWVAVHGETVLGFFDSVDAAFLRCTQEVGGPGSCLVREITEADKPDILHRVWG